jgi:hypothetical protein
MDFIWAENKCALLFGRDQGVFELQNSVRFSIYSNVLDFMVLKFPILKRAIKLYLYSYSERKLRVFQDC